MPADYERIPSSNRKPGGARNILILLVLAFVGGAIATGWVLSRYDVFTTERAAETAAATPAPVEELSERITADGTVAPPSDANTLAAAQALALTPEKERALSARVGELEDRLSRINVQAQAAGGNAARAEGLLIAFAARRALDRGSQLGYIENQLRLRFGEAQPNAVQTILTASRSPVTLETLTRELDDIAPVLATGSTGSGFWTDFQRELSELFVVRKSGTPSPAPQQRLDRAKRYLESGNVEAAIAEVDKMPGSESAGGWIQRARRFNEARRALDVIETAAILEPRELRDARGETVEQPSPLTPEGTTNPLPPG